MKTERVRNGEYASERAASELRQRIAAGELAGGQRLIEADLATELGVGRSTLREAFQRLAVEGLVVTSPNRGTSVRRITVDDVRQIYDVREVLEGKAAGLAALRMDDPAHRRRLLDALERNDALPPESWDPNSWLENSKDFHGVLIELAENWLIAQTVRQIHAQSLPVLRRQLLTAASSRLVSIEDSAQAHREIGRAVLDGDAEQSELLMRHHVRTVGFGVVAHLERA